MNTIVIGQLDGENRLHGIGKKIRPWDIIEGEFQKGLLNGFGRHVLQNGT